MKKLYLSLFGIMLCFGSRGFAAGSDLTLDEEGEYLDAFVKAGVSVVKQVPAGCAACFRGAKKVVAAIPDGAVLIAGHFNQAKGVVDTGLSYANEFADIVAKILPDDPDAQKLKSFISSAASTWGKAAILIDRAGTFLISTSATTATFDQQLNFLDKMVKASGSTPRSKFLAGYAGIFMPDDYRAGKGFDIKTRTILYTLDILGFFLMGAEAPTASAATSSGIVTLTKGVKTFSLKRPTAVPTELNILTPTADVTTGTARFDALLRELIANAGFSLAQVSNVASKPLPITPWPGTA